jgi:hypothetical protein
VIGDSQNLNGPPSSEQVAFAAGSSTLKVKVAVVSNVAMSGPVWIVTTAGVASPTSHSYTAGSRSAVPCGPTARTRSSCGPKGRFV